ncbi:MAG: recombinase RecT, partial [Bacteroidaceae bacterium]|nr:recombinase RecT [Bacteroidaceae bacterium]
YRFINADFVYEGELRTTNRLTGEIALDGERKSDKIVGYFAYMELLNGFSKTLYMSVEEMAKYAKRYAPSLGKGTTVEALIKLANEEPKGKQVGWMGNFSDMALKTVIRRLLSKYGYLSVEMQGAITDDMEVNENRDNLIAESANTIDLQESDVVFEKEGSEVKPATDTPTQDIEEDPGY